MAHNIEHALAARKIANMLASGYSRKCSIAQAAKLVQSQGFSAKYSKSVAEEMSNLV